MTTRALTLMVAVVLGVGCGQYPGVHEEAVSSGEIPAGPAGSTLGDAAAPVPGSTGGGGTGGTGAVGGGGSSLPTGGTSGGTVPSGGATGGAGGKGGKGGGKTGSAGGGTTTGVTPTTIKIGIHAPLTGAAPLAAHRSTWARTSTGRKATGASPS